ncbi:MAG: hypothetical protein HGA85_05145, partial [Nanoarchaeota archaeon]|nr:hypothetical protein [Nanoarchaeota archaeon]
MHHKKMTFLENLKEFYIHKYKTLFWALGFVALTAFFIILMTYIRTGDFTSRDVSLKGGIAITINKQSVNTAELESFLTSKLPKSSIILRTIDSGGKVNGVIIE